MRELLVGPFFKDTLKKTKFITIASAVLILLSAVAPAVLYIWQFVFGKDAVAPTTLSIDKMPAIGVVVTYLVPLTMIIRWDYMTKRNHCDFYDALPIRRSSMALSAMCAVFVTTAIPIIIAFFLLWLATLPCHGTAVFVNYQAYFI